ncbi:MAG TPA: hypothetical protein VL069_00890, partial [Opitutus sp.]|nr:hypothetical protein [Opitutus sp.]
AHDALALGKPTRFPGEVGKHLLRDIVREMSISADAPQADRINHFDVPPDQLGERHIGFRFSEKPE